MSGWPLAFVIVAALSTNLLASIICGHLANCHDVMPQIGTVCTSVIVGAFALATQEIKTRRKSKHQTGPHRTVGNDE